jgi:hypothetical protein
VDCDQDEKECGITPVELRSLLEKSLEDETGLLRTYTILAERIHDNVELRERLHNFAEGNAKRSRQLQDELQSLH